jgi:hypothetical protein
MFVDMILRAQELFGLARKRVDLHPRLVVRNSDALGADTGTMKPLQNHSDYLGRGCENLDYLGGSKVLAVFGGVWMRAACD